MALDKFSDTATLSTEQVDRAKPLGNDGAEAGSETISKLQESATPAQAKKTTDASPSVASSEDDMLENDKAEDAFYESLVHPKHYDSLAESLTKIDPEKENPLALQAAQVTLGVIDGFSRRLDNFGNPELRTEAIAETGFGVASSIGISWALTKLAYSKAYKAPEIGRAISRGFKYAFLADVALEVGETIYSGIDTWNHPDHYKANTDSVAGSLGSSLFDLTTLGPASVIGFEAGEATFGLGTLKSKFAAFSKRSGDFIPRIEFNSFRGLPKTVEEPPGTDIANLYVAQVPGVVRVNKASGLIVDGEEGLIASNFHVAQGKSEHYATTSGGQSLRLNLIARDRDADIAVFRTVQQPGESLPQTTLAQSSSLPPGSETYLISHPQFSPKALIATQTSDGYELAPALNKERVNNRPVAYNRGIGTGAPGSSGGPLFNEAGEVVAQNARGDFSNNFRSGPAVEHLNEVLRQIRLHKPYEGVLDVKSRAETLQDETGKLRVALPIKVTSTATVLNKEGLARKAQQRWTTDSERYPRSRDLGEFRFFALPAVADLSSSSWKTMNSFMTAADQPATTDSETNDNLDRFK